MKTAVIIANKENRKFKSEMETSLHKIIDKTMMKKQYDYFKDLDFDQIISVVNHKSIIKDQFKDMEVVVDNNFDILDLLKLENLSDKGYTIVTYGNIPLITKETYQLLLDTVKEYPMVVLTGNLEDYDDNDIIIRNPARTLRHLVKFADATSDQKRISEVNMNVYAFNNQLLKKYLKELADTPFDLNDLIKLFKSDGSKVMPILLDDVTEGIRIEGRRDLILANYWEKQRIINFWLDNGVTILNKESLIIGDNVKIGPDTIIYPNNEITGKTIIGKNNILESNNKIVDSVIKEGNIFKNSIIVKSKIENNNCFGPWSNLRENVKIGSDNKIGSNVELKNVKLGNFNAIAHTAYLGDSILGDNNNIGWGVVTANYDGVNKNQTIIGNHSFIGSSSTIIAPVKIGDYVLVAAGSTITNDIEDDALAIGRSRQENKPNKGKIYLERTK